MISQLSNMITFSLLQFKANLIGRRKNILKEMDTDQYMGYN